MTNPSLIRCFRGTLAVVAFTSSPAAALEPWADPNLSVLDGLELWYDAATLPAALQAQGKPAVSSGQAVAVWLDASGRGRALSAAAQSAAPLWRDDLALPGTRVAVVRFDGRDDYLAATFTNLAFRETSCFIVAAPRSNRGMFRALLSMNQAGKNDYITGLNIDLGPAGSTRFDVVNPEGAGFVGASDLLPRQFPFGTFHTLSFVSEPGTNGASLWMDRQLAGKRDRNESVLRADQLHLGARLYSNTREPARPSGFIDGDIAEVLVYSRRLSDADRELVEKYLTNKHAALLRLRPEQSAGGDELHAVSDPPPLQMFAPGFTVRELPVRLSNINGVKYRPDGKLVALGYNGRIHLLSDSDGDGLEDRVQPFWDKDTLRAPIGMALTPVGYERGNGLFVAGKGKVVLIVDTNRDDRADQEIVLAQGWPELPHGVDALGVAVDKEGAVYFGLGTANFTDAYLMDPKTGRARYDLRNERGTILKVRPDFSGREILCTGIRFPVAMAFNRAGDLFATDQEGATWLPNGNPLDELLHIEAGRHYGFPPRHPRHLPGVIDEPSVFDYVPQHQSTCGLNFNEPVLDNGPVFGPPQWRGDAFVTGYSRGKLYRTQLTKTPAGYVARTELFGCLNMLTVDAAVSTRGDLVVAAHSGQPDWGSGPNGEGKLFQVRYTGREEPQPLFTYAVSPTRTALVFDRPIPLERVQKLNPLMTGGHHVAAGDRFESLRPGYQVVQDQLASERFPVPVLGLQLSADHKTIFLSSHSRAQAVPYSLVLPGMGRPAMTNAATATLRQYPGIDLGFDLTGVEAAWQAKDGATNWSGWLPHGDLSVARRFTAGSDEHQRLWNVARQNGTLTLRTQLDLAQMLRPKVQPGAAIAYEWPKEKIQLNLVANVPVKCTSRTPGVTIASDGRHAVQLSVAEQALAGRWLDVSIEISTGGTEPDLAISWRTAEDSRPRALPLRRFFLPWAWPHAPDVKETSTIPQLSGGDWFRGEKLFFGEQLGCAKCHRLRGRGAQFGPDLSNLIHRDYESVWQDIRQPNAAINPDHLAYNVTLKNGETVTGLLQADDSRAIVLGDASGQRHQFTRTDVASIKPSTISLMPEGLDQALVGGQLADLMTFLLTTPLEPAPLTAAVEAPAPTRWSDWQSLIGSNSMGSAVTKPLRILLAAGPKDHGPGEHDYPLWRERWKTLLSLAQGVTVDTTMDWPRKQHFDGADVIVFYSNNPGWSAERGRELDAFLGRGGGLVYIHYAVDGHRDCQALSDRIGLAWQGGKSRFRHGPLNLRFTNPTHPITQGFTNVQLIDESYWVLVGDPGNIDLLATAEEEGQPQPLLWAREQGDGRVFVSIPGHYTWTFDDPMFRLLLLRGIAWAARQDPQRLAFLSTVGARVLD